MRVVAADLVHEAEQEENGSNYDNEGQLRATPMAERYLRGFEVDES